ncbi:hypothetical protein CFELI_00940 [Corynebacterium felinum]|nr:hypothetical protein CFELI_00940 [Corynebacterium felinum]
METMAFLLELKRIAYDSVTLGGNKHLRKGFLKAEKQRGLFQAVAARGAVALVRIAPQFMFALVTRSYRKNGMEVLGLGYHSVVVADGADGVKKYHHRTLHMSQEQRQAYIERLYRKQDVLKAHFPDAMIASQEFVVEQFPLNQQLHTVVSVQKRIRNIPLFHENIRANHKVMQLCQDMFESANALPDVVGKSNFFFTDTHEGIVIVDTIPVEESDPTDWEAYIRAQEILWGEIKRP